MWYVVVVSACGFLESGKIISGREISGRC